MEQPKELMLYLHVPFCVRKCHYCDFLSSVHTEETRERYVRALCRELRVRGKEYSGRIVTSVFFGGGTPSLLSPAQILTILDTAREIFAFATNAEITMECNPGTISFQSKKMDQKGMAAAEKQGKDAFDEKEKLAGYLAAGVNRLSLGLQSANDEELKLLGRIHDYETFLETYRLARKAGFTNINVDLMNALPGQTMESWKNTLECVLTLTPPPEHLSVYSLIVEEGTPFFEWNSQGRFTGKLQIPSEELDREMYAYTGKRLAQAGYQQYEISNYAREGYPCRHNYGYWTRKEYLGLGLGAASLLGNVRYANETDLERYLKDPLAGRSEQTLSRKEQMEEFAFLGLRTIRGVSRSTFQECFGESMDQYWRQVIEKNVADGLLMDDGEFIRLSARGLDLGNYVSAQFLL
ncbi:MAG: radical SAM protein [Lachnospiraceae bacterium]|nr:radical SAM protein [Lachnospiraceae bacterium]MBR6152574.1 radical SAM protein [Lachnospiraceae bacterium]